MALLVYGTEVRTLLPHTPGSEQDKLLQALDSLRPEGSTHAEAGLVQGYQEALKVFDPNAEFSGIWYSERNRILWRSP